jgi:ABC-2 type transport system ATP-binding protein
MSEFAIRTSALSRMFGAVTAVAGLDLEVRPGEMFALVGPDGAGKSTAIRLLCGILRPTSGEGEVLGLDLHREPEAIKARIGYLSQAFTLYGDLTVDENIEFFGDLHGVPDFARRRTELLDFTRLTPFRRRLAQALSGGMKKKLALACTLIHTPEVIFLDEPSTGVDPISRGEFWTILSGLLDRNVTVLLTTPYLDEAERCHRIGLMHHGRLVRTGTPDEIKRSVPGAVYRIECPAPKRAAPLLRAAWPDARVVLYGDHVTLMTEAGPDRASAAVARLNAEGYGPASFVPVEASLEDVFVALMSAEPSSGGLP